LHFIFKSEVETIDIKKGYSKKIIFCPSCYKTQVKKLNFNNYYIEYQCWNKDCEETGIPFLVLNEYIQNENIFDGLCDSCHDPLYRDFTINENQNNILIFKCENKLCESNIEPFSYNLTNNEWEGKPPRFILYDNIGDSDRFNTKAKINKIVFELEKENITESISPEVLVEQNGYDLLYKVEEIPLLSMNSEEYSNFMDYHQHKVVILVDIPNFIRTLRGLFPHNFEDVLKKAHGFLLQYIENSFHASSDYIIRYFSKPDKDLEIPNTIIINFCSENRDREFFHLLKLKKGDGYSDIDNYLIANGVEIIERCEIRGFVIVSSDKDYLPVMRIASYKKIKSGIIGINTPEIYNEYDIMDITFLGVMKEITFLGIT